MDILHLLRKDHDAFRSMMKEMEETTQRAIQTRKALFEKFRLELLSHAHAEEKTLYEELKRVHRDEDLILEATEEHHVAERTVKELEHLNPDEETWLPKIAVLKENVEHHLKEEEEKMFKHAHAAFSEETRVAIGESFLAQKELIRARMEK